MKSAPGIAFEYQPSRTVAIAIVGVTLLGLLAVVLSGLALLLKLAIAVAALGYAAWSLNRHLGSNVVRIANGAGGWLLVDAEGAEFPVELADAIHRGVLIVLGFRGESGSVRRFLLAPDNSDADLRRRLLLSVAASRNSAAAKTTN